MPSDPPSNLPPQPPWAGTPNESAETPPRLEPPVLPPQSPTPPPWPVHTPQVQGRLHPLSLVFRAWQTIRGIIIPAIIFIALGNERTVGILMLILVVIPMTVAVIRYFTFTYRIEADDLILKHGLLGRTERHIPLARVQDIRIEQGILHRFLRMADVQIETAGAQGAEASLSVLSLSEAEHLRQVIFENVPGKHAPASATPGRQTEPTQVIRSVTLRELVIAGLTSNKLASVMAMVVVAERLANNFLPKDRYEHLLNDFVRFVEKWAQGGLETAWVSMILGGLALTLIGILLSVAGSVINFYGFTLSRVGEDLHRAYGLITRRSSSLPRGRIQVLQVEEKLLRRIFKLATLRADTAGSVTPNQRASTGGRDVLLPILRRDEVDGLLPVFFPDWKAGEANWRLVSRRAIYRGTIKGVLLCLIVTGACVLRRPEWMSLWPLVFTPFIYILNMLSYKHLGYGMGGRYFRTRRGWLGRATHVVPIRNTQTVVLRQTPFDRRHKVRTLSVDTAGQAYTGGGPQIANVPEEEALLLARVLARRAASARYRWKPPSVDD